MSFFAETLISGLFAGVMYALVAIGFVLIYKASGVFNFAQGAMLLFSALCFVTLTEHDVPFVLAFALTALVMIAMAFVIERLVLRPLRNRDALTLFMATLGLSYVIEGLAQLLMGTDVHMLDLGIPDIISVPRIRGGYPAEKPAEIAEVLVRQSSEPGAVVADPFMGSGSVGVAALRLGRRFLGNDLNPEAVRIAAQRLREFGVGRVPPEVAERQPDQPDLLESITTRP